MDAARSYTEHTNYHDNLESYLQILPYIVVFLLNRLFRFRFIFFFHTRQKCVAGEKWNWYRWVFVFEKNKNDPSPLLSKCVDKDIGANGRTATHTTVGTAFYIDVNAAEYMRSCDFMYRDDNDVHFVSC